MISKKPRKWLQIELFQENKSMKRTSNWEKGMLSCVALKMSKHLKVRDGGTKDMETWRITGADIFLLPQKAK